MRIRTVKPQFWSHPILGRLDDCAKLLAIGLLNMCDDEGFFRAETLVIRNTIRPFDDDSVKTHGAITDLSRIGFIEIRNHPVEGPIGRVVNFLKHQVINRPKPSTLAAYWNYCGNSKSQTNTNHGSISDASVINHGSIHDGSVGNGREWNGKEGRGSGAGAPVEPPPGFPRSEEEAVESCKMFGVPAEFAVEKYHLAVGAGYRDRHGKIITRWAHYVKGEHVGRESNRAEKRANQPQNGYPAKNGERRDLSKRLPGETKEEYDKRYMRMVMS